MLNEQHKNPTENALTENADEQMCAEETVGTLTEAASDVAEVSEEVQAEAALPEPSEKNARRKKGKFRKKKPLWKRILKVLLILLIVLLCMLLIAGITFFILYQVGKSSMLDYDNVVVNFSRSSEEISVMEEADIEITTTEQIITYDDGKTVVHDGHTYRLNENIATVLIIGVDKEEIVGGEIYGNGGEADCVLLVALDTDTGKTKVISISREAYAQVDIYSASGKYLESRSTQLCRAYAYGDGAELSCENMVKSVRRIIYGLPIHSYIALDMRFVAGATDAVNGVTLPVLSDVLLPDGTLLETGTVATLWGENAERYVRWRDKTNLESNEIRMERQKQYIQVFVAKLIAETKGDLTTILDVYNAMSEYMVTDLSIADATFLLTCLLGNGVQTEFKSIKGTTVKYDINAMFYLDEENLFQTVLDVFYTKVD